MTETTKKGYANKKGRGVISTIGAPFRVKYKQSGEELLVVALQSNGYAVLAPPNGGPFRFSGNLFEHYEFVRFETERPVLP